METSNNVTMNWNDCTQPVIIVQTTQGNTWNMFAPNPNETYEQIYNMFVKWLIARGLQGLQSTVSESVLEMYLDEQSKKLSPDHLKHTYSMLRSALLMYENIDIEQYKKLEMVIERSFVQPKGNMFARNSNETYEQIYNMFMKWLTARGFQGLQSTASESALEMYLDEHSKKLPPDHLRHTYSMLRSTLLMYENIDIGQYKKLETLIERSACTYSAKRNLKLNTGIESPENTNKAKKVRIERLTKKEGKPKKLVDEADDKFKTLKNGERIYVKYCFVPSCKNNSRTSKKLFIHVPEHEETRKKWFDTVYKNYNKRTPKSTIHCCEDHFDLEKDLVNWRFFKTIGCRIHLKKNVLPHRNIHELEPHIPESQFSAAEEKRKIQNINKFHFADESFRFEEVYIPEKTIVEVPNNLEDNNLQDPIQESTKLVDSLKTEPNNEFTNTNSPQKINENNTEIILIKEECQIKEELEHVNSYNINEEYVVKEELEDTNSCNINEEYVVKEELEDTNSCNINEEYIVKEELEDTNSNNISGVYNTFNVESAINIKQEEDQGSSTHTNIYQTLL